MKFLNVLFSGIYTSERERVYEVCNYTETVEKWRKAFSKKLFFETGEWRLGGYDWHVFTFGYTAAVAGSAAVEKYRTVQSGAGYVFSHSGRNQVCVYARKLPSHQAIRYALDLFPEMADVYIYGGDGVWTFVVTHEERSGIGPFFASSVDTPE